METLRDSLVCCYEHISIQPSRTDKSQRIWEEQQVRLDQIWIYMYITLIGSMWYVLVD